MQITVCDFCRKETTPYSLAGKSDNVAYRFLVEKPNEAFERGVHWKKVDICESCFVNLLEKMLDERAPSMAKKSSAPNNTSEAQNHLTTAPCCEGEAPHAGNTGTSA